MQNNMDTTKQYEMTQDTTKTDSFKIDSELLDKIRYIAKSKGQTISGYIRVCLLKQVSKDWMRFNK